MIVEGMIIQRSFAAAWVVACVTACAIGQPPMAQEKSEASRVDATLARMRTALGGDEALAALTSLRVEASCSGPGGPFETKVASFRSDWVWFHQESGGRVTEIWSAPERSWSVDASGETREHPPGVRFFVRAHEFHLLLFEVSTRFSEHRMGMPTTVRGNECVSVSMKDEMGQEASLFLDRTNHVPVMLEMNPEGAAGVLRIYFEQWETKAGLRFFRTFELTEGDDRTFRYDYRSIEPNVVSALEFVEPAATGRSGDQRALLDVLRDDRRAHLETDVALLTKNIADELIEVSSGSVQRRTRADVRNLFERVFDGVSYAQWEDLEPPRIKISADGTLAWVVRRVGVRRVVTASGQAQQSSFVSAYASTYEKHSGRWMMTSVTSTFVPRSGDG